MSLRSIDDQIALEHEGGGRMDAYRAYLERKARWHPNYQFDPEREAFKAGWEARAVWPGWR